MRLHPSRCASADEREFVERHIAHVLPGWVRQWLLAYVIFSGAIAASAPRAAHVLVRRELIILSCLGLSLALACLAIRRHVWLKRYAGAALWAVSSVGYCQLMSFFHRQGIVDDFFFRATVLAMATQICAVGSLTFVPNSRYVLTILLVLSFGATARSVGLSSFWILLYGACTVGQLVISRMFEDGHVKATQRDFNHKRQTAPRHVLRHMHPGLTDVRAAFQPSMRSCLCICSDWRGYQKLSMTMTPAELTQLLNAYYEMCDEVLAQHLPDGNYYMDWIADELFVVIYGAHGTGDPASDRATVDCGIKASRALTEAKAAFAKARSLSLSIDVGLAFGEAYVGMMGPSGFPKATALGSTPGRARRVQTVGKRLREERGDCDRVIFGEDTWQAMTKDGEGFEAPLVWEVPTRGTLRDLDDSRLYVYEDERPRAVRSAA